MTPTSNAKLGRAFLCLLVQLNLGSLAASQEIARTDQDPDSARDIGLHSEGLPRFKIEFVVFEYNAFDPTEEEFGYEREVQNSDSPTAPADLPSNSADEAPVSENDLPGEASQLISDNDINGSPGPSFQFELLDQADLTLTAARDKLERLDAYTVLVHGGWIQEGLPEQDSHKIDMSLFGDPRVTGTLQFHLNRFAHVTAALNYTVSTQMLNSDIGGEPMTSLGSFKLHQTRRMRSGELHYFDHPAFGLLVVVRPYDDGREDKVVSGAGSERSIRPAA